MFRFLSRCHLMVIGRVLAAAAFLASTAACTSPAARDTVTPSPAVTSRAVVTATPAPGTSGGAGRADDSPLVLIVMENHESSSIVGASDAPFLNETLMPRGRVFTDYTAVAHPSLPNYLAMTAGDTLGKTGTDDISAGELTSDNLFHQLSTAGVSWRAFQETMPSPCFRGTSAGSEPGTYALKHDPAMAFANIAASPLCQQVVPFDELRTDELPAFSFVTPNECSDMHSCDVATGDRWLSRSVPPLLEAGATVIVTFDEGSSDEGGGGRILLLEVGPGIPAGARETAAFDHYSLLAALEDRFDVPRLGEARTAEPVPL